jgi:lysozyme family protein
MTGGKTYAELSASAQADPTNTELADQVSTVFKGETLRGLLLNAYAFGTMATIAGIAAIVSFVGAAVMLLLSGLGFWHARRTPLGTELLVGHKELVTL